ncbi:ligase-associated DNA damage response exonuclease [Polaribacter dokdonensis]|uniref:Metallo-beta-lactamase superfamily protein n=1 Tax=Polaribacter dokdonensis DSW-5 TaxID=1300348 RepID=A0A0M9CFY8_9FLAO|nr:ligase-associated DNA damage response exonuclease [Polaribacter dokdonensis]KOY51369.1 Metallo-beta-lactamase superfamily protein [Polaribacter dokdonensis DSW-5]SEE12829.1 putative mRNA 3-end processing factor [Polaribacter dokdonensis DSW-5]
MKFIKFTKKGIYCIPGKFYLDPWFPVDYAIISHGHADHARWGNKHYLCHNDSKAILKHRIGQDISIESMGYNEPKMINGVQVSFHPAGHIIGSAQIRLEHKGYVIVFSGDYKTQPDFISVPFEPVKCNEFITESTFGLPIYKWKSELDLQAELQNWILQNQQNNRTSVFIGYSLGKAQRIMKLVEGVDDVFVHSAINNLNNAISDSGIIIPETTLIKPDFDKKDIQNKIVILPPALLGSKMLKRIPNAATAICSGWMHIRGNRRWKGVDAGFAVSDHADWDGLLEAVKATEAEKVYVTHGSQAVFSKYLNEIGIEAHELKTEYGEDELAKQDTLKTETA